MQVKYSYLAEQFADTEAYFRDLRELVASGEFTLGPYVEAFERDFAKYVGAKHAIGMNTGTDALILALKSLGIGAGDEVITVANTFYATVGAIVATGARPVFVDSDDRYSIDVTQIENKITSRTKAILPVHWAGAPAEMDAILNIADKHGVYVVEDACPSVGARIDGKHVGTFGDVNAFSMHPLKPLNVWGDGGIIVTDDDKINDWIRLYRNHGMVDRDHIEIWGINNRLQPVQAVVARRVLPQVQDLTERRIRNAQQLDRELKGLAEFVRVPARPKNMREVYQLYIVSVKRRDELLKHLQSKGIEARVHYPLPLHLQKAAEGLGYKKGDFPRAEQQANEIITLPAHQHVSSEQISYIVDEMRSFYL
ncbi:MAG: DegT/DnrJ/EryC1/StrS family aminotransferase [Bdellovibrionota bacterium]